MTNKISKDIKKDKKPPASTNLVDMKTSKQNNEALTKSKDVKKTSNDNTPNEQHTIKELGGRQGLEPTRYGDWEKNGRCIDF